MRTCFRRVVTLLGVLWLGMPGIVVAQQEEGPVYRSPGTQPRVTVTPRVSLGADDRQGSLQATIATLDRLIAQRAPSGMSDEDRKTWNEQTTWLRSVRRRYADLAASESAAPPGSDDMSRSSIESRGMRSMDSRLSSLQRTVQNESRKFQTLSNASKARHDTAMNAIRNMK